MVFQRCGVPATCAPGPAGAQEAGYAAGQKKAPVDTGAIQNPKPLNDVKIAAYPSLQNFFQVCILSNACLTKEGDVAHYTHASRVPFILSNVCLTKEGDVAHYFEQRLPDEGR